MNNSFLKFLVFLFCIPLIVAASPSKTVYEPLDDLDLYKHAEIDLVVSYEQKYFLFTLNGWSQNKDSPVMRSLEKEVTFSTKQIFLFAKDNGLPFNDCKKIYNIDIYMVNYSVLNDRNRFNQWQGFSPNSNKRIRGLYAPRVQEANVSAIVLTPQGKDTSTVIAHEMAHYWYDRFCWDQNWNGGTENFARRFEALYESIRMF